MKDLTLLQTVRPSSVGIQKGGYSVRIRGTECVPSFHVFPPDSETGAVCQCGEARLSMMQNERQFIRARKLNEAEKAKALS